MHFDEIIQQANDAYYGTQRSEVMAAAIVIASALRSLSSSTRAIASGNGPNGATGLEMVSVAITTQLTDLNRILERYVTVLENEPFEDH